MIYRLKNTGYSGDLDHYVGDLRQAGFKIEVDGEELFKIYHIEISTVDALVLLAKTVGKELIVDDDYTIEIYDYYRE